MVNIRFEILFVEPDPVVADVQLNSCKTVSWFAPDLDVRLDVDTAELETVGDEILQELSHLEWISFDCRKVAQCHRAVCLLNPIFEITYDLLPNFCELNGDERLGLTADTRKCQQIIDERLHSAGGGLHPHQIVAAFRRQMSA